MKIKAETDCIINYLKFKDGDSVKEGDEILQVEMMKMMTPYTTLVSGTIKYLVKQYDYVYAGTVMAEVV
jgi:biotin carboxyl carrier protein